MITSFEVGAIFIIEDRGTPALERLGEGFTALDAKITAVQEKLAAVGKGEGLFSGVTAGLEGLNSLFTTAAEKAAQLGDAMVSGIGRGAAAAREATGDIDRMAAAMDRASAAAGRYGAASGAASGAGGGGGGGALDFGDWNAPPRGGGGYVAPLLAGSAADRALTYGGPRGGGGGGGGGGGDFVDVPFEPVEPLLLGGPRGAGGGAGFMGGPPGSGPGERSGLPGGAGGAAAAGQAGGRHGPGIGSFITAGMVYEAMKSGISEEQSIDTALIRGFNIDPRSPDAQKYKDQLRQAAHDAAQGTSFTESEVAAGLTTLSAPMGLSGPEGVKQFLGIFDPAAKASEASKQLHFGTFEGSLTAAVEVAHMLQQYGPGGLIPSLDMVGKIAESIPGGTMESEARAMSYILPAGRALGADPMQLMAATGFLQRAGLQGTVGATTLRQMLVGLAREGGPMNAQVTTAKRGLEDALKLEPGHLSGGKTSAHEQALQELHLADKSGKLLELNEAGGIDVNKMFQILAQDRAGMTPVKFGQLMYAGFGIRGQQGGEIIADALPQYDAYQARLAQTPGLGDQLSMINQTTGQQTGQAVARVADVGTAIGTDWLGGLRVLDQAAIAAATSLYKIAVEHPGDTMVGSGGFTVGGLIGGGMIFKKAFDWLTGGGPGAVPYGPLAAGAGPSFLSQAGPLATGVGMAGLGKGILDWSSDTVMDSIYGAGWSEQHRKNLELGSPLHAENWGWIGSMFSPPAAGALPGPRPENLSMSPQPTQPFGKRPENLSSGEPRAAAAAPTIHIGPITLNGLSDQGVIATIMRQLTDAIHTAIMTGTSDAHGTHLSPYTQP